MLTPDEQRKDVDELDAIRRELLRFRLETSEAIIRIFERAKAEEYSRPNICDIGWCLREIERIAEEIRKDSLSRKDTLGKLLAFRVIQDTMNDPDRMGESLTIHGRFASGTPDVSQAAALPRKDTEEYRCLCKSLGIPDEVIESGVVQFSFPQMATLVSKRTSEGKNPPQGLAKPFPVYRTTFRTKTRTEKQRKKN